MERRANAPFSLKSWRTKMTAVTKEAFDAYVNQHCDGRDSGAQHRT